MTNSINSVYDFWEIDSQQFQFQFKVINKTTISLTVLNTTLFGYYIIKFKKLGRQNRYASYLSLCPFANKLKILLENNNIIELNSNSNNSNVYLFILTSYPLITLL